MSPETIGAIGLVILVVLLLLRMWIGVAMSLVGFIGYAIIRGWESSFYMVGQIPFSTVNFYPLTTIPLFVFMGVLLFNCGVGKDLYETAYTWVGQLRGGLAMATVLACALFGAITGVSAPALVTMGKVAIPQMKKYGYDEKLATGSVAVAGTLAILIPPSIPMIIYGILTENSIGRLLIAGLLPGVLLSVLFIITIMIMTAINPQIGPAGPKTTTKAKLISLKGTWATLILFILILGGIYGGIFTPTEAGAVGTFGAVIIALIQRRLTVGNLTDSMLEAARTTAMILFLIIGAFIMMKFLAVSRLPHLLGASIAGLDVAPMVVLALLVVLYIILGMFLDIMSAVIITMPVVYPLVTSMGFDPLWFGVIVILTVQMGLITPPVGLDVFILGGALNIQLSTIFRGVLPFLVTIVVCIIILAIFPEIATLLPSLM
jgi:tripartite ATP-independent transporter DctM subunit